MVKTHGFPVNIFPYINQSNEGEDAAVCEQLLLDAPRELFVIAAWPCLAQEAQAVT